MLTCQTVIKNLSTILRLVLVLSVLVFIAPSLSFAPSSSLSIHHSNNPHIVVRPARPFAPLIPCEFYFHPSSPLVNIPRQWRGRCSGLIWGRLHKFASPHVLVRLKMCSLPKLKAITRKMC